jgi:glycosyltransferase involved in cell wall biosynthesis
MWLNTFFTAISLARRPDVLFFPWSVLPRVLVAPAVVTVHDVCFRSHPDRFADRGRGGDAVLEAAVRVATEVVTPSAESKRGVVAAYGLDEQRVTIVRHGIAPTFQPTPAPGDAAALCRVGLTPPYFLCVSTHEPRKNLDVLARAFVMYLEQRTEFGPPPELVFVGRRSADTASIVDTVAASSLARQHTKFVEGVSDADLAALYRHALAAVLPSVCEGFGFPVLESIACGTPAVVSDLPVFHELVGDAAVYVPVSDVAGWAAALVRALTDERLRANARAAASDVGRTFGWPASACQTLSVLQRAARAK